VAGTKFLAANDANRRVKKSFDAPVRVIGVIRGQNGRKTHH